MKILELRFKNLNSLYGEWCIDFRGEPYASQGIFALVGPTGAGKSTLLDAMCLALYGQTPRLGRITKSDNEIMSRHTGECYAEVVFAGQGGVFRCHWEQRRARKSPTGRLQEPDHQIADASTGILLESKRRLVVDVVEQKTGMNFDRFQRAVLLAQGQFDAFLKADVGEKSEMLEQITGTAMYSEISQRVHEQTRMEQQQLQQLQAQLEGVALLAPEQVHAYQLAIQQEKQAQEQLQQQLNVLQQASRWIDIQHLLRIEIQQLSEEAQRLQQAQLAFKPDQERLLLAQQAARIQPSYSSLLRLRQQRQEQEQTFQALQEQQRQQQQQLLPLQNTYEQCLTIYQQLLGMSESLSLWLDEIEQVNYALRRYQEAWQTGQKSQQLWQQKHKQTKQLHQQSQQAKQQLQQYQEQIQAQNAHIAHLLEGRLLREWQTEKEQLQREQALWLRIASYEEQRQRLVKGEVCPLCGALEHPFAEQAATQPTELEQRLELVDQRLQALEQVEQDLRKLANQEQHVHREFAVLYSQWQQSRDQEQESLENYQQQQAELAQQQAQLSKRCAQTQTHWQTIHLPQESRMILAPLLRHVQQALQKWTEPLTMHTWPLVPVQMLRQQWQALLQQARQQQERAAQQYQHVEKEVDRLAQQLLQVEHYQHTLKTEILEQEYRFAQALAGTFQDEAAFLAAQLPENVLADLQRKEQQLAQQVLENRTLLANAQQRLEQEQRKKLTTLDQVALTTQIEQVEKQLQHIQDSIGRNRYALEQHEKEKARWENQQKRVLEQQAVYEQWLALHELIGSADGKKYRNFAQGLTFELLVAQANQQLTKMTDRYLLLHQTEQPLALFVIDNYQGGEVRSVKNLSGGESFIVSLALALGLSQMASQTVQVDSLFLDEGFGTLDEEALDVALTTLAQLQGEGKLIGIISHVPALKERIATQIHVLPQVGGRSRLQGPGCRVLIN